MLSDCPWEARSRCEGLLGRILTRKRTVWFAKKGLCVRADFTYDPVADHYVCPAGALLTNVKAHPTGTATTSKIAISTPALPARYGSGARPRR